MMNRIGDVEVTDVTHAEYSECPVSGKTQVAFFRAGDATPPGVVGAGKTMVAFMTLTTFFGHGERPLPEFVAVPSSVRVVADGVDYGEKLICCAGRDRRPGGYVSVRWEAD